MSIMIGPRHRLFFFLAESSPSTLLAGFTIANLSVALSHHPLRPLSISLFMFLNGRLYQLTHQVLGFKLSENLLKKRKERAHGNSVA